MQEEPYINIFYTNCSSIINKIQELKTICITECCDVLCLTETHLTSEINDAEIFIENFTIFRGDRNDGREKGGSIIYVNNNNIACAKIDYFNPNDSLAVLLDLPDFKFAVACVYRSPSLMHDENLKLIDQINNLKLSFPFGTEIMILGDFNLPDVLWDTGTVVCPQNTKNRQYIIQKKFIDTFLDNELHWHLNDGTITRRRIYGGSLQESLLDQVLTSDPALLVDCVVSAPLGKSDHNAIISRVKCENLPGYTITDKKCGSKISLKNLAQIGENIDSVYTGEISVDSIWNHLSERLLRISEHVPITKTETSVNGSVHMRSP